MPSHKKNHRRSIRNRRKPAHPKNQQPGVYAPLQGIDQKNWRQNDLVPISIRPGLSIPAGVPCIVVVAADCNGYSWQIQRQDTAAVLGAQTRLYGEDSNQFTANALIYEEYRIKNVTLDVKLNQGGSLFSFGPLVKVMDPIGILDQLNSAATAQTLNQILESMRNCVLTNPYKPASQHLDYEKWILQTQETAWKKMQTTNTTIIGREKYITNPAGGTSNFRTPGLAFAFTVTASQSISTAQLGIFETKTAYIFRQRRLDPSINPLLSEEQRYRIREMQQQILVESAKCLEPSGSQYPSVSADESTICQKQTGRSNPYSYPPQEHSMIVTTPRQQLSSAGHPPAHMQARVGEALHPGPGFAIDSRVLAVPEDVASSDTQFEPLSPLISRAGNPATPYPSNGGQRCSTSDARRR